MKKVLILGCPGAGEKYICKKTQRQNRTSIVLS